MTAGVRHRSPRSDSSSPQGDAVRVCTGSGCIALGAIEVAEAVRSGLDAAGLELGDGCRACRVGCRGSCSDGPLVELPGLGILYGRVRPEDVDEIVQRTLVRGEPVERLLLSDPRTGRRVRGPDRDPFFSGQQRRVLARCGIFDPEDIDQAISLGAYRALRHALDELDPAAVIDLVKRSGLQERGGAGFPTGLKWAVVAETPVEPRVVVGNGESGDIGLTADRTLLEGDPHAVIEGMVIAGFAVGARFGRLFLRTEHALGLERAERAVEQAVARGFLGSSILGTGFDFAIEVCENAGVSMGGEETALLNVLQGRRGAARPRPPFPAKSGLWGRPTLINGLETLANVPWIVEASRTGAPARAQTKVLGVSGAVARSGLVEVPLGTSVREVVEEVAGGCTDGEIIGVHVGGPGGATLAPHQLDTPIEPAAFRGHGTQLGSGSLVVLGERSCPVALARILMAFCADESCGTCPPCRIGSSVALELLDRIGGGAAVPADLDRLEGLCGHVQTTAMCELGRNASASVLSGLRNFREVYERHLDGRGCPTGVCR